MLGNRGKIGFIIFVFCLNSCTAQDRESDSAFFEGLKKRQDGANAEAVAAFEKALNSSNTSIAAVSAAELMVLHSDETEIPAKTMSRVRQKLTGAPFGASWARALETLDQKGGESREKALSFLLTGGNRFPDGAALYASRKLRPVFTAAENAAVDGRIAVSRFRYSEALLFFRIVLYSAPELFWRYPDLLADLGRSFQYTAATGREGIELFLGWEQLFAEGSPLLAAIPPGSENLVRFRLLFFAARIARQRNAPHIALFEKALPFAAEAPDDQSDACIWYILDSSLTQGPAETIRHLETLIPQWRDNSYFFDVMDKLSRELVLRRQWENIVKVFSLLRALSQDRSGMATAEFAWIIGRAIEEGFFSPEEISQANELLSGGLAAGTVVLPNAQKVAQTYMRAAYTIENALYYRFVSSVVLDEPFLALAPESAPPAESTSDALQFLLGFFEHDAAEFAPIYIRAIESELSPDELRVLAEALGAAGQHQESIRLVSLYAGKNGYQATRRDMELWYPRPFLQMVEQYAQEINLDPALLFALIRTESAFNSDIASHAGAIGLTQLMPATAEEMADRIRRRGGPDYTGDSGLNLRDPAVNIHIGAAYLAYLHERMENPLLALLAYNGGMSRVRRWHRSAQDLPPDLFLETVEYPETRNYGKRVTAAMEVYRELYYKQN